MAKGKARGGAEAAAKRDEEVRRTMERLEEGVRGVFESGRYRRYLAVMSRFHGYSANNCLLIAMQRPDATLVAGYRAWQDKFGRQVRKGERGMKILSPVVVKAKAAGDDIGEARDDSAEEGVGRRLAGFRLATVFDVSQTEGRELPTLGVEELTGGVARYEAAMRAVSEDMDAARLMGINVNSTISFTFAVGSALAGIGSVLYCCSYPQATPTMGSMLGLKAFVAAVLGGIGSIPGAMVGGIAIGLCECFVSAIGLSAWKDAVTFAILIIVLLVKPTGFLGRKVQEKV